MPDAAERLIEVLGRASFGTGHVLTTRPFPEPFGPLPGPRTYATALKLETAFDAVRLVYGNDQPSPFTIAGACIATPATPGADGVPLDAQGAAMGWTPVTFGGGQTGLAMPAAATQGIPVFACSDWVTCPSTPPAEDDGLPWLMTRTFIPEGGRCILVDAATLDLFNTPDQGKGRTLNAFHRDGDWVSQPAAMTGATPYGFLAPVAIQYRSRAAGITVMCVGDSITRGRGTRSHYAPWGLRAIAALSHPDRPVTFVNAGRDGARTAIFHATARSFLDVAWPEVMVIAPYSPNDTYDVGAPPVPWQEGLGRALTLARDAAAHGCLPVLTTPLAWSGTNAASEAARRNVTSELRRLAALGVTVWDLDTAVTDQGNPARLPQEYGGDGIHPNDTGHSRMARVATEALGPILRMLAHAGPRSSGKTTPSEERYREEGGGRTGPAPPSGGNGNNAGTKVPASWESAVSSSAALITEIDIGFAEGGNSDAFLRGGWAQAERHGRWSNGQESRLTVEGIAAGDYQVSLNLGPFILPPLIVQQNLQIIVNGRLVWADYVRGNRNINFGLPADLFAGGSRLEFRFICPTARAPSTVSESRDVRVLGFTIWNLRLWRTGGEASQVVQPAPVELSPTRPRVAAITMVYNEPVYLPIWLKHYGAQVGIENCYVIDHGSDDGSTDGLKGCNVVRIPRSPYDPHKQSAFNSLFCSSMTNWYDRVIYSDVDEILLADPKIAPTLTEYCRRPLPDVVTAIGLNLIHRPDHEPPFDPERPVSTQRPYAFCASSMCKPLLIRNPITWSPGSHSSDAPIVFDHLYMFHLRWFDLPYGLRRLHKTRAMAWASLEAGAHQRFEDEKFTSAHMGFARLQARDGVEFDPTADPISGFTQKVLDSRAGRENQTYKIDLGIWPRDLWRLPERFIGTF